MTDIAPLLAQISDAFTNLVSENTAQAATIADLQAQLAAQQPTPAPSSKPVLGLAVHGGTQTNWTAAIKALGVTPKVFHCYHGNGNIPTSYSAASEGRLTPPAQSVLVNLKPQAGQGAALTAYCKSLPAGSRVILHHEPENDGITPAQYAAEWERDAAFVRQALVPVGVCFMSSTARAGTNTYLAAISSRPDFVAVDGYAHASSGYKSAKTLFDPTRQQADAKWPGVEQVIAEWGADGTGQARADWITQAGAYFADAGYSLICYFDNPKGATGNYLIDTDPASAEALAALA